MTRELDESRYIVVHACERDVIFHLDGVDWCDAPVPKRRHKCWAQTKGFTLPAEWVFRCACGAMAFDKPQHFQQKNSRRKGGE